VLVQPETFPQQPSRPASFHCIANLAAGHHSQPCRRIFGEQKPVHNQTTADRPFSFRFGLKKIASQFQPAGMGETKRARRLDAHAKIKPASNVCVRRGGDWPKWLCRSWWNYDSKNRAAVCGEFSMVDIGVSCFLTKLCRTAMGWVNEPFAGAGTLPQLPQRERRT
jgi:hypothetical protein